MNADAAAASVSVDVGLEAWARRWSFSDDGKRIALSTSLLIAPDDAARTRDERGAIVAWGQPVRAAVLVGDERGVELAARAALLAAGARVATVIRVEDRTTFLERAASLRSLSPDVVVVLAGERRHADASAELCEALRLGCAYQAPLPRVLVWGDPRMTIRLYGVLSGWPLEVLADPRAAGAAALIARCRELRRGTNASLVLRDEALEALARALARIAGAPAAVVDVGGDATSIVRADPDGTLVPIHVGGPGVGRGADHIVARGGLDRVRRWIPFAVDAPSLLERVFNRARWPDAVSTDRTTLALEIALAHEALAHALDEAEASGIDRVRIAETPLVAVTGRAAELPRPAQTLLVAADALRPSVLCSVLRDRGDAFVALGAIASASREGDAAAAIAVELEARHEPLALVAPLDAGKATVRIVGDGVAREERIARGDLRIVSLRGAVDLTASAAHLRGRGVADGLGVLLDARRPLELPDRESDRLPVMRRWYDALEAFPA